MKNKLISTFLLAVLLFAAVIGEYNAPLEVFASTKTATLVETKVSFDGREPVTVQSYRIDGYNYVRVAEIAKHVNMLVMPAYGETGVLIVPHKPYDSGEVERISDVSINVELTTGAVIYAGMRYSAQCFNYENRYYYKLADLIAASEHALESSVEYAKRISNSAAYSGVRPEDRKFTTFKLEWDSVASTAKVNSVTTDLQVIFDETRTANGTQYGTSQNAIPVNAVATAPIAAPKPEMTEAPETGTFPANILVDTNKGAYNSDGSVNTDNLTAYYRNNDKGFVGQCTWYAAGRFYEIIGIDIVNNPNRITGTALEYWVKEAVKDTHPNITGTTDINKITSKSIAVWKNHVLFVEYVECDSDGNPAYVYFTEANTGHDGVYRSEKDAKVQKMTFDNFVKRDNRSPLIGYVMAK